MMRAIIIGIVPGVAAIMVLAIFRPSPPPIPIERFPSRMAWHQTHVDLYDWGVHRVEPESTVLGDHVFQSFVFEAAPLHEVLDWIAEAVEMNMAVDWRLLWESGINDQTPVTLRLHHVSAHRALEATLAYAALTSGQAVEHLRFRVQENVIEVTTDEDVRTFVRVYEVGDLVDDFDEIDRLVDVLMPEPEVWGGRRPVWLEYRGRLFVRETPRNHERITAMLRLLRGQAEQSEVQ